MPAGTGSQLDLSLASLVGLAFRVGLQRTLTGYSTHPTLIPLSASAPLTPLELIQEQPEVDCLTLPTGTTVFRAGETVQFIHVIDRGSMELSNGLLNRIRFGRGDLFFYEDLVDPTECHSRDARAVTPVSLFRLSRSNFLTLIHRHPTLVLQLLSKQHSRLRQQRVDARHFY